MSTVGDKATLSYCLTSNGTFVPLAAIIEMTPNKISAKEVTTTKLSSDAAESQPGTPDYGECTVTCETSAALTTLVNGWIAAKTIPYFKLSVDDSASTDSVQAFSAWVKEFEPMAGDLKRDERATSKLTLKITGVASFTAAS